MNFKKWIKSIQTAGYNGARTVYIIRLLNTSPLLLISCTPAKRIKGSAISSVLILCFHLFPVIDSLSNLSVRIPEYIQNGQTADLTCSFNLGGDKLYSVKWYKGRHEFYRYMPGQDPVIKTFPVKGMEINVSC